MLVPGEGSGPSSPQPPPRPPPPPPPSPLPSPSTGGGGVTAPGTASGGGAGRVLCLGVTFWSMNLFTKARTISQHLNIFFVLLWLVVLDMNFWHSCFLVIVYKLVQTSVQIEKVVRTQTLTTARGSSSATSVKPTVRSAPLPSSSVPIQWTVIYQRGWTVEPGLGDIETDLNNLCFQNFKRCERILYNKNIYSGP